MLLACIGQVVEARHHRLGPRPLERHDALSGAARSFVHLALPRVLVGVGEATLTPAALSMLGDAFPARRLGLATGIYYAGLPIGTALSLAWPAGSRHDSAGACVSTCSG